MMLLNKVPQNGASRTMIVLSICNVVLPPAVLRTIKEFLQSIGTYCSPVFFTVKM